jgi:hypothetical protein
MSKYGNRKCQYNGIIFDSIREMNRYKELLLLQKAGEISDLQLQVPFVLIPTQREYTDDVFKTGPNKGQPKFGKVIERSCIYIADFTYYENGQYIVEDAKGKKTKEYLIKRKLMLHVHGHRIRET